MQILHLYKDYFPVLGGIENHIRALAEAQAAGGHDVTVLVTAQGRESSREVINGVNVVRAGRLASLASTPLSVALPRLLGGLRPEIAHLHFPYPIGEISHLLAGRSRTVITYHSDVVRGSQQAILRLYRPLMFVVLRRAGRIIATSPNYVVSSPHLRRLADRCVIVPLGVNVRAFTAETQQPTVSSLQSPSAKRGPQGISVSGFTKPGSGNTLLMPNSSEAISPHTLIFLGRLRYYKGLESLLEAMPGIDARLIVGGDGPMRAEWQAMTDRLNLNDKVTFVGNVADEDLARFYRQGDLFVLPANARSEAFGTVLLEAMACGLACVTTELGTGTSYVVQDGVTGAVVPPRSPRALAEAINRLLADDELRARLAQAGLERVRREFTVETMVERVQAVYEAVSGRTTVARADRAVSPGM